jgi:RNA polymerase sigma factor (sigma-70 family)
MTEDPTLPDLVTRAQTGDGGALERVVRAIQDDVFDLAVRMLGNAEDARDACQEALVRIVTGLGSFRGESSFRTWTYRVAANAFLNYRGTLRRPEITFARAGDILDAAVASLSEDTGILDPAQQALVGEVKLACAHGMLTCLDRPHRLAYILGEILDLSGEDAAAILEISAAAFRQRLSRARNDMEDFLRAHCGVANPANRCRCKDLVPLALAEGLVDPKRPMLGRLPTRESDRLQVEIERVRTAAEVYRSLPKFAAPTDFAAALRAVLEAHDRNAD